MTTEQSEAETPVVFVTLGGRQWYCLKMSFWRGGGTGEQAPEAPHPGLGWRFLGSLLSH